MNEIYQVDLLEEGFRLRKIDGEMRLYRKEDEIIVANLKQDGKLEVLLHLDILDGKKGVQNEKEPSA